MAGVLKKKCRFNLHLRMSKKIKVLECIRQGKIGGGESHLLSLVENLDRVLFDPVVLSFTEGPMIDRLEKMGIISHIIHTEKPFDFTKWGRVRKLLERERIDIIHAHGTRANSNVIWAARSLNIPVIYTIHGWSFHNDQNPVVRRLRILGEKYLTSKANINISVSESNKVSGKKYLNKFESLVINNGIDQSKYSPNNETKDIRKELGIADDVILILFVARFTHQKQPLLLIKAFQEAISSFPQMHLLMVGEGEQKEAALQLVKESGVRENITFLPFRQDVPDLLSTGDIFVLPSLWEGLPIGLLEAMSMGKAIIATNVDGTSEVIENNVNGLLVETGNATDLAKSLLRLSMDEQLRLRLQKNALKTVREKYNAEEMTRQIEYIYKSTLHGI